MPDDEAIHTLPPPQAKLPGSKPYKAVRDPAVLPVPFIPFPVNQLDDPRFAPPPPARGFFLWNEIPRVKLRGLGPADSIILRHAVSIGLIDPGRILLAPLIPTAPATPDLPTPPLSRNLLECPDAPLQPDAILTGIRYIPPPEPPIEPAPALAEYVWMAEPPPDGPMVLEIKPNAGYVAVGQVLCYHWAWMTHYGDRWPLRPAILTDWPRPYMPRFCGSLGITLLILGAMLVEPPPWPT